MCEQMVINVGKCECRSRNILADNEGNVIMAAYGELKCRSYSSNLPEESYHHLTWISSLYESIGRIWTDW